MSDEPQDTAMPFSGDLHQAINPWSWAASMMQQAGFININNFESSAPKLEQDIIENIASYGRQINVLNELMGILVQNIDSKNLTLDQQQAMSSFKVLQHRIDCLKESRQPDLTVEDVEAFSAGRNNKGKTPNAETQASF